MPQKTRVYVMRVASQLAGMHPQTLRKYERAGLISPARKRTLRTYSDEDIARLRTIKYLVSEIGLNLAGVDLFLSLRAKLLELMDLVETLETKDSLGRSLEQVMDEILNALSPPDYLD